MAAADPNRGTVKEIVFVTQYPDGQVRVSRLNPTNVARIVLDPQECEQLLGSGTWSTGDPSRNPAFVVVRNDAASSAVGSCRPIDHPPIDPL